MGEEVGCAGPECEGGGAVEVGGEGREDGDEDAGVESLVGSVHVDTPEGFPQTPGVWGPVPPRKRRRMDDIPRQERRRP